MRKVETVATRESPSIHYRGFVEPNALFRIIDEIHMTKRFPVRKLQLPILSIIKHDSSIGLAVEELGNGLLVIDNPHEYVNAFVSSTNSSIRFNPRVSHRPDMSEGSPIVEFETQGRLTTRAGHTLSSHIFTINTNSEIQHPNQHMYPLTSGPIS